jgi:hypothetical protein
VVERVLPGEADAAVHLDRALARGDRRSVANAFAARRRSGALVVSATHQAAQ